MPSQHLQDQLQTQHNVDTGNYIMDTHNIKQKINYGKLLEENTLMEKVNKQTSKQTKMRGNKNYITQNIIISSLRQIEVTIQKSKYLEIQFNSYNNNNCDIKLKSLF
jgi:hypothetical protein